VSTLPESDSVVLLNVKNQVATIVINRPQRHNSLVSELLTQLKDSFTRIKERDDTRVVVLKAAGKSFSTGGDLRAFWQNRDDIEAYSSNLVGDLNDAIASIIECDFPVIVAVNGQVTGGSLGLVLGCDIIVVTERASFTPYYVDVGLSPDGGWTAMLPDIIGHSRASAVQLLNKTISAQQAVDWGIASLMTPVDRLDQTLDEICTQIIGKKRGSLQMTKHLLREKSYLERLDEERRAFMQKIAGREAQFGIEEFISERQ
jgi:2-(1,2-epoxy-1,2-dihydrophenyl)acetyl-CoA isomerase